MSSITDILAEIQANTTFGNGQVVISPKVNGLPFSFTIPVSQNTEQMGSSILSALMLGVALYQTAVNHPHTTSGVAQ